MCVEIVSVVSVVAVRRVADTIAVVVGEEDAFVNVNYLEDLKNGGILPTLWRGDIQMINNAGHAPHFERPTRFNTMLRNFINFVN